MLTRTVGTVLAFAVLACPVRAFEVEVPVPIALVQAVGDEWLPVVAVIDTDEMHVSDPEVRFAGPGRLAVDTTVKIAGQTGRLTLTTTHIRVTEIPGVFVFEDLAVETRGLSQALAERIEQALRAYEGQRLTAVPPESSAYTLASVLKRLVLGMDTLTAIVGI